MAATSFSIFSLLFALLSGGATDLLDLVPSDGYWKAKNVVAVTVDQLVTEITPQAGANIADLIKALGSGNPAERDGAASKIRAMGPAAVPALEKAADDPDPEVANRVRGLSEQIKLNSKAAGVRKLMAIRTLGEMKKPEALPALRALVNSKEMFVADYATRAIAQIEGKPLPARGAPAAQLKADLTLLPAKCGVVGQFSFASTKPISIEQVAKQVPVMPGEDRRQSLEMLTGHVIAIADQIGNVRIEGVTFGVADDVGPNGGFAAVIVRGQWDA
ncbi:MAG TPA: HEAT repeat domain-containing protein, partial [Tepidisphaeraceae bacterium]